MNVRLVSAPLAAFALVAAACSGGGLPQATNVPATPAQQAASSAVTAGTQIGILPTAPSGWVPPASITPVNPLPGMFQSVGTTPQPQAAKVRVFFLGMQW